MHDELQTKLLKEWNLPGPLDGLIIKFEKISEKSFKIPLFSNPNHVIYWTLSGRRIEYSDGSIVSIKRVRLHWTATIQANSFERKMELGKLVHLSVFGILEELKGRMRIHGALFQRPKSKNGVVVFGEPGSGKSSLAYQQTISNKRVVFADELILFDGNHFEGVPLKLHIKDSKTKIPIGSIFKNVKIKYFLILEKGKQTELAFSGLSMKDHLGLFFRLVTGEGLHQMAAYHLSFSNSLIWLKILFTRVRLTFFLLNSLRFKKIWLKKLIAPSSHSYTSVEL